MSQYTNPKSWGPHFWYMMRCVAHNYSEYPGETEKNSVKTFYYNLKHILPCEVCRTHYSRVLRKHKLEESLCCKSCLISWVETVYREVNNSLK